MGDFRVLVTGFVPFGKHRINASQAVVRALGNAKLPGVCVTTLVLPVVFAEAWAAVRAHLDGLPAGERPHALVLTGMAAKSTKVRLERLAVNLADCESFAAPGRRPIARPDNAGQAPVDRPIVPGGPLALPARADVKALARTLKAAGLPIELSLSAGAYVCNDIYYRALAHLESAGDPMACVFVHLPELPRRRPVRVLGLTLPIVRYTRLSLALNLQVATVRALVAALAPR